jgi:hypothetical protein
VVNFSTSIRSSPVICSKASQKSSTGGESHWYGHRKARTSKQQASKQASKQPSRTKRNKVRILTFVRHLNMNECTE